MPEAEGGEDEGRPGLAGALPPLEDIARPARALAGGSSLCGRWAPGNVRSQASACPVSDGWEVSPVSALSYLQTGGTTKHSMCAVVTHDMALVACTHRRYRVVETKQKDK